jgi:hypothetical protein
MLHSTMWYADLTHSRGRRLVAQSQQRSIGDGVFVDIAIDVLNSLVRVPQVRVGVWRDVM